MSGDRIRVFIVDDHELFRDGLKAALAREEDIDVVGEADRFEGTADLIADLVPDVAVIDVRLGDGSGIDLCKQLKTRELPTRCLIFTAATGEEGLYHAILAGASGYLLKTGSAKEVVTAIRALGAGLALIDPAVTESLLARLRHESRQHLSDLTNQELQVLELVGEGLTNVAIADRLDLAEQTVKNYVSHILNKLDLNRTQAALYAAAAKRDDEESDEAR